jgi:hypothetical protein
MEGMREGLCVFLPPGDRRCLTQIYLALGWPLQGGTILRPAGVQGAEKHPGVAGVKCWYVVF